LLTIGSTRSPANTINLVAFLLSTHKNYSKAEKAYQDAAAGRLVDFPALLLANLACPVVCCWKLMVGQYRYKKKTNLVLEWELFRIIEQLA